MFRKYLVCNFVFMFFYAVTHINVKQIKKANERHDFLLPKWKTFAAHFYF